jgi:hypothetical protein
MNVGTVFQAHAHYRRSEQLGDFDTGLSGLDDARCVLRA